MKSNIEESHNFRVKHRCGPKSGVCKGGVCTLAEAGCGRKLHVEKLVGDENFRVKMMEQGIFPGSSISLVCGRKDHPCVISTGDNTLMMDSVSAELILVSPEKE